MQTMVVLGASLEDNALSQASEKTYLLDRIQAATGVRPVLYELADGGTTSGDLRNSIDAKLTTLTNAGVAKNKTTKFLIGSIIGNDVSDNRPYATSKDPILATMVSNLNYILDAIEAWGGDWILMDATFRDYGDTTYANESLGSLPFIERVSDVVNAARGRYLFAGTNKSWAEVYPVSYNNNVAWLQYDNIHHTPAGETGYRNHIADKIAIPLIRGIAPSRTTKNAYVPRPTATIAVLGSPAPENGQLTYRITLSAPVYWDTRLTLQYGGTAVAGTDYTAGPAELVIPAGQTVGNVVIQGLGDDVVDGDKTLIVTINTTGDGYVRTSPFSATGTFTDGTVAPNLPTVSISGAPVVNEGQAMVFTVNASPAPLSDLVVGVAWSGTATRNADYTAPDSITIPAGQTSATLTVGTIDDADVEGAETVIATLQAGSGYTVGTPASATGTINASDQVSSGPMDVGKKVIFNMGASGKPAAAGTNTFTDASAGQPAPYTYVANALNTAGEATGVSFVLTGRLTGSNSYGANSNGVQDRSFAEITSEMLHSSIFGNSNSVPGRFEIRGLPAGTYRYLTGATRLDTSTTTNARITTVNFPNGQGSSFTYDTASAKTAGTENWHGQTTVTVGADGVLTVEYSNALASGNFWYVAAIILERLS
jgi:hypothetical protein